MRLINELSDDKTKDILLLNKSIKLFNICYIKSIHSMTQMIENPNLQ